MRIGPYEVVSTLGQGGMGVVFAARSPEHGSVAVKVLHRNGREILARFDRERRLLASLGEADGFVPLLDSGATPHGPYLVMPLVPGGTLRDKLAAGPLPIGEAIALGRKLALALGEAHARGIVHRDMKPENVLFTASGAPLIADLGLAKHFDSGSPGTSQSVSLSRTGEFRGTAGYMAPEQMANARNVGPPADVFALGAILYECLAGRPAFEGETILDLVGKVGEGTFTPLRERRPDVPEWLADVIERALARSAGDRHADGLALGRALASGRPARGAPRLLAASVVATVALTATVALAFAAAGRPPTRAPAPIPAPPVAPVPRPSPPEAVASPERVERLLRSGEERALRGDFDGAIAEYDRAIALDPRCAEAWGNRAFVKGNRGDVEGAIADYDRAIELDATHAGAWVNRGYARCQKGDFDGAIADTGRAIELDPRNALAWANRGLARGQKGDLDGTVTDSTRAIELDPELGEAWLNRGSARGKKGDLAGLIADYERFLELAPGAANAPAVRAEIERARELQKEARPDR